MTVLTFPSCSNPVSAVNSNHWSLVAICFPGNIFPELISSSSQSHSEPQGNPTAGVRQSPGAEGTSSQEQQRGSPNTGMKTAPGWQAAGPACETSGTVAQGCGQGLENGQPRSVGLDSHAQCSAKISCRRSTASATSSWPQPKGASLPDPSVVRPPGDPLLEGGVPGLPDSPVHRLRDLSLGGGDARLSPSLGQPSGDPSLQQGGAGLPDSAARGSFLEEGGAGLPDPMARVQVLDQTDSSFASVGHRARPQSLDPTTPCRALL